MAATFFTADQHFGDHRRLAIDRRPFPDVAAMDRAMVERWNAAVAPGDTVWHLGDFARSRDPAALAALLDALHGTKHLVVGNNDGPATLAAPGFASVRHYAEIEADGVGLVLCHYAFRSWNGQSRGRINLHGHSHGRLKPMTRQYDVGVDARDFQPVRVAELLRTRASRSSAPRV